MYIVELHVTVNNTKYSDVQQCFHCEYVTPETMKCTYDFMSSSRYFCALSHKFRLSGHIFIKFPHTKFHTNPSNRSRAYLTNKTGTIPDDGNAVLRMRICYTVLLCLLIYNIYYLFRDENQYVAN
jgi:hypothetical protein